MNIGFMGGTFSPPHVGHLYSAESFYNDASLDLLYIIPAKVSPFKTNTDSTASEKDRLEMTRLCFRKLYDKGMNVIISDMEITKDGTSYTFETVENLMKIHPGCNLFMYVGSDMYFSLERWKNVDVIFKNCVIYTKARNSDEDSLIKTAAEMYNKKYCVSTIISDDAEIIVSSTLLREFFALGTPEKARNLLTDEVLGYIIKNGLYL